MPGDEEDDYAGGAHLDVAVAGGMAVAIRTLPPRAVAPAARLPTAPQTAAATTARAPRFCFRIGSSGEAREYAPSLDERHAKHVLPQCLSPKRLKISF